VNCCAATRAAEPPDARRIESCHFFLGSGTL
jgi:hypothetical protein